MLPAVEQREMLPPSHAPHLSRWLTQPFSHFGNCEALPGGVGLGRAQNQGYCRVLNGCTPPAGGLCHSFWKEARKHKLNNIFHWNCLVYLFAIILDSILWGFEVKHEQASGFCCSVSLSICICFHVNFSYYVTHKLQILSYKWDFWKQSVN